MLESNPERRYVVYKIASGGLFPPKLHFIPTMIYHPILWYLRKSKDWKLISNDDDNKNYIYILKPKVTVYATILIKRTSRDCIRIMAADLRRNKVIYTSAPTAHKAAIIITNLRKELENMKGEAIYLGFRKQRSKAWADQITGEVHQPKDYISFTFIQNTWTEQGEITEQGLYFNEKVEVSNNEDQTLPNYTIGKIYEIQILDVTKRTCKVLKEVDTGDLPF